MIAINHSNENRFTGTLNESIVLLLGFSSLLLLSCKNTGRDTIAEKIKGEWVEVRRTNTYNSSFNKNHGTFYIPGWHLNITDSNYIFLKIKGNQETKEYPYGIFYDSILVMENQYYNNLFWIKKVDSQHLVLARLPTKWDPYPRDTVLYHFVHEKYYNQLSSQQKKSLSSLTRQDTLYVLRLIYDIVPPEIGTWGSWYQYVFTPEKSPVPVKWSKNISIHLDTSEEYAYRSVYDITVYNTGHNISLGYDYIEIDTSGKIYTGGYVDELNLMYPLFKKYVQGHIRWTSATTLGFKCPADIEANIHYRR